MIDTRTLDPTEIDNIIQDIRSYNFMMNMALSRFKHKTNIKELQDHDWYNEINLAYAGMLGLFHDDELDKFILLRCAPLGRPNFYGTYSQYICTAMNGKTFRVKADDIVILYDNIDRKPVTASDIIDTSDGYIDLMFDINEFAVVYFECQKTAIKSDRGYSYEKSVLIDKGNK